VLHVVAEAADEAGAALEHVLELLAAAFRVREEVDLAEGQRGEAAVGQRAGVLLGRERRPLGRAHEEQHADGLARIHEGHAEQAAVAAAFGKAGRERMARFASALDGDGLAAQQHRLAEGAGVGPARAELGRPLAGDGDDFEVLAAVDDALDERAIRTCRDEGALRDRVDDLLVGEGGGDRFGGAAERGLLARTALGLRACGAQRALGPAPLRDILRDAEHADGAAVLDHRDEADAHLAPASVPRLDLELDALRRAAQGVVERAPRARCPGGTTPVKIAPTSSFSENPVSASAAGLALVQRPRGSSENAASGLSSKSERKRCQLASASRRRRSTSATSRPRRSANEAMEASSSMRATSSWVKALRSVRRSRTSAPAGSSSENSGATSARQWPHERAR